MEQHQNGTLAFINNSYQENLDTVGKEVLSDSVRQIAEYTVVLLMLPLNLLGLVTNLINIRVFIEQGVKNDNSNIAFVCLSLFDFFSCLTSIPYSLCYVITKIDDVSQRLTCIAFATQFLHGHVVFQFSSAWTTVYMSVVRSLCVVIPLKVKLLFTPSTTLIVIITLFIFFFLTLLPYAAFTRIVWVFHPVLNTTIAYIIDSSFARDYLHVSHILHNHTLLVVAIVIVFITTSLMIHKLLQVKKWRQKNATNFQKEPKDDEQSSDKKPLASKDIELVKSVTVVTCIFALCSLMGYIPATAIVTLPGVNFTGINRNLFYLTYLIRFLFDAVNSSINFFFYIRISSRYKEAFASSFKCCFNSE